MLDNGGKKKVLSLTLSSANVKDESFTFTYHICRMVRCLDTEIRKLNYLEDWYANKYLFVSYM